MLKSILLLTCVASAAGFALPFEVRPAVTNITQGGQTLEQTGLFFVANLTIGTPGQLFTVVIDTKTSDLLVPDVSCKTESNCYNKRRFNQAASSSYYAYGQTYNYKSNLGSFQGFVGKDTAVIGDRKTDLITIPAVRFLQVTSLGLGIEGLAADGVLGMARGASQIDGNNPFVQGVNQGDVSNTFFSIWLEHYNQTDDLGTHGVIYYGGFDPVHCVPNPSYAPLSNANTYQLTVSKFQAIGKHATNNNNKYIQATLDTTSGRLSLPTSYLSQILDSIGININTVTVYPPIVPCDTKITLTFGFVSGTYIQITERDLVANPYGGACQLQVVPNPNGEIILGIPTFRGRCTYFDPILQRIGFTPAILQD